MINLQSYETQLTDAACNIGENNVTLKYDN